MTTMEIILVTLVAAICGMGSVLDERQTHRPLVACTLIGLVLGDLETGIIVGGTLELVALGWMNVGAAMAPDAALASVIATILVIKGGQDKGSALAIAIPVAAAGQVLTIFVRTLTSSFNTKPMILPQKRTSEVLNSVTLAALHYKRYAWQFQPSSLR